ncbi:sodium-dependent transporter family protein [Marinobacter adhaerens HP15]|uniref:Sodium-dependent transporter family protein n=1 Tax=Marinobacter adhaerens (strain DSM 23420 / HP15) TaxID=225937 RepID=E4PPI2_MARAH|nr:sodium-dependent transporter family protein [Marinobacter adhaerens HP15]
MGATVGLANLWQFPYLASLHGGGLFILLYLACLLLVTLPLMVTEAAVGRYSRHGIVLAMDGLIRSARQSRAWMAVGRLSILAAFLVLSFTAVFGSIALAYVFFGALGRFSGAGEVEATGILAGLVSDPRQYRVFMGWHIFFLLLVLWVSAQGVVRGLERALRVVVPGALVLMLVLFALAAWHGRIDGAINHILAMHPEDLSWESLKAALFHAFFTLGLGMGVWAILGSYTTPQTRLKRSILAVVLMDTLVAILAGLMIFAIATDGNSFDGERGFSLLFVSMPVTLAQLPASQFVIAAVFLLVVLIVWTTSLNLLEPIVGWFREWTGAPRALSVLLIGLSVWLAGLASLLSFNVWAEERMGGATMFRWLELITGGLLIPLVAILIALFTGWCLTRHLSGTMLGATPRLFAGIWFWVMRLVLPLVVAWIGIQYTAFSLANLCSNGNVAAWCDQPAAMVSEGGEVPAGDRPFAATPAEPEEKAAEAEKTAPASDQKPPGVEESGGKSGEKAPKQDDILYDSV